MVVLSLEDKFKIALRAIGAEIVDFAGRVAVGDKEEISTAAAAYALRRAAPRQTLDTAVLVGKAGADGRASRCRSTSISFADW